MKNLLETRALHGQLASQNETLDQKVRERTKELEDARLDTLVRLALAAEYLAYTHHERWDGTGYPDGLRGEEIPLPGRLVAMADVLDALTHDRVYRKALALEKALEMMTGDSGKHFDPQVVEALLVAVKGADGLLPLTPDPPIAVRSLPIGTGRARQ